MPVRIINFLRKPGICFENATAEAVGFDSMKSNSMADPNLKCNKICLHSVRYAVYHENQTGMECQFCYLLSLAKS